MSLSRYIAAIAICTVLSIGLAGAYLIGTTHTEPNTELQAEVARLKTYEALFNDHNLTLTYNGCEDMRERLGL
ncbi:MAG: hypothetical protein KAR40_09780 [Candidatus Sabulitectum sp.]|nr:hypothetical protein [Candidatus Sabulitectum sp.]